MNPILFAVIVLAVLGLAGGAILVLASKFMAVYEDPRIAQITDCLAGANCGGCGYAGCADYAKAIVEQGAPTFKCAPGGDKCADAINAMLDAGFIPVIAPVGTDGQGNTYNINGDTAAGKLASALGAEKLVILTDIEGLCNDIKVRDVISYLNIQDVKPLKDKGTIAGGMIPKVDCCVEAIEEGVTSVHIIDGRKPHSVLYEAFTTEGTGTTIGTAQPSVGIKW